MPESKRVAALKAFNPTETDAGRKKKRSAILPQYRRLRGHPGFVGRPASSSPSCTFYIWFSHFYPDKPDYMVTLMLPPTGPFPPLPCQQKLKREAAACLRGRLLPCCLRGEKDNTLCRVITQQCLFGACEAASAMSRPCFLFPSY